MRGTRTLAGQSHILAMRRARLGATASPANPEAIVLMHRFLKLLCTGWAVFSMTAPLHADQVLLNNGDRLTGTVVRKEGDQLVLQTAYAGELKIAWAHVAEVRTDEPMSLILSDQTIVQASVIGAASTPRATAAESEDAAEPPQARPVEKADSILAVDSIAYINAGPGIDLLGVRWKGRVSIGASGHRGNSDIDNLHIDGEAVARLQRERYTLNAVLDRGKDRNVVTQQNSRLSGKYDLFMDRTWYGYGLLTIEEDRFRDIDRRITLGAGLGHQLIEDERTNLSVEGGLNHVRTDFGLAPDENYPAARWALKFDQRLFGTELRLFHSHELISDLQASERTFVLSQTGLRVPLWQGLLATAQLNVDFDNAPAAGKAKADRTYLFTLGYHW